MTLEQSSLGKEVRVNRLGTMLIVATLALFACGGEESTLSGRAKILEPKNSADLLVQLTISKNGKQAVRRGECMVTADGPSFSGIAGGDFFAPKGRIAPGDSVTGIAVLRIEDNGARRVKSVKVQNCREA